MKLRKIEFAVIAITIAFACFTGGFFAGRRAVRVISVVPENRLTVTSSDSAKLPAADSETPSGTAESVPPSKTHDNVTPSETAIPPNNADTASPYDTAAPSGNMININTASREELTSLPGIGDTLAGRIIEFRESYDGFAGVSELMLVNGIGEKKFEAIKDYVCVD